MSAILLIAPGCVDSQGELFFPLGLAYVSSALRAAGYETACLNLNHFPRQEHRTLVQTAVACHNPRYVGLGALSVFLEELIRVVGFIRETRSDLEIVLGGGAVTADPETVFAALKPSYAVLGEGEETIVALTDYLFKKSDRALEQIPGLAFRRDRRLVLTPPYQPSGNIDDYPYPDLEGLGIENYCDVRARDRSTYHLTTRPVVDVPICASRSCPFQCTFCFHPLGGRYRERSNESLIREILFLRGKYAFDRLTIYAELFARNREKLLDFCRRLKELSLGFRWSAQLRVDELDPELLGLMKAAGCDFVSLGFESASPVVLQSMRKKITVQQIENAVQAVRAARMGLQANFLYGDPAETPQTVAETSTFKRRLHLNFVSWTKVVPYPGTALYRHCRDRGLIPDPLDFTLRLQSAGRLNMTSMDNRTYERIWSELFDFNEWHCRERPARLLSSERRGTTVSRIAIACPSCGAEQHMTLHYPPEMSATGPILRFPVGLKGVAVLCETCNRKMYVLPTMFAHVAPLYRAFQDAIDRAAGQNLPVYVTPCIQKIELFLNLGIDFSKLKLAGALDNDPAKTGTFLGAPVLARTREVLESAGPCLVFVLPSPYWQAIKAELLAIGLKPNAVIIWDELFLSAFQKINGDPA